MLNGSSALDTLTMLIVLAVFAYVSRELEIYRIINEIENYLVIFGNIRRKAITTTIDVFKKFSGKNSNEKRIEEKVKELIEISIIPPVTLDPYGIVKKMKHIFSVAENVIERDIKELAPSAQEREIKNLLDLVEATRALNFIYKVIDHYYRIARKFKSLWLLMQLSALLPFISEEIKALEGAIDAFTKGVPIGDSAGPLVVSLFLRKYDKELSTVFEPIKDTVVSKLNILERRIYLVKAKGPGGTVGHLDEAIEWVIKREPRISLILTIDASLKLEGEETGMITHGFGVAMGGTGIERYGIEEIATRHKIPLYALLIKMSESDSLSVMDKRIYDACLKAVDIVERIILTKTRNGENIIVVGVGNTIGVPP